MNPNWHWWMIASTNKHFIDALQPSGIFIQAQGQKISNSVKHAKKEWLEIRIDGPFFTPVQKYTKAEIEVNILVSVIDGNAYRIHHISGLVAAAMKTAPKYYEITDQGDLTFNSCMYFPLNEKEKIHTAYFGIVHAGTDIEQLSVETHYELKLF